MLGHWSKLSVTPSLSVSFCESEQPFESATSPLGVFGQVSKSLATPSSSISGSQTSPIPSSSKSN